MGKSILAIIPGRVHPIKVTGTKAVRDSISIAFKRKVFVVVIVKETLLKANTEPQPQY